MIVLDHMNIKNGIILTVIATVMAFGQATAPSRPTAPPDSPPTPEFEVASIRPSAPPSAGGNVQVGLHLDGAMVRINYFSLRDYLAMAYDMKPFQVVGPDWLSSDRFDVSAKLPDNSKRDQIPKMLQALFRDRFKMTTHTDSKEFPVYALIVGKGGSKLKDAGSGESDPGAVNVTASGGPAGVSVNMPNGGSFTFANDQFEGRKLTLASFADTLWRFLDRPCVDMTGLTGAYNFTLKLAPEDYQAMRVRSALSAGVNLPPQALRILDDATDESLFSALEALGLKLEKRKAPLEVLVIDHMEKLPTSN
jgi:uncharacterized protein (TIGR03435 family)